MFYVNMASFGNPETANQALTDLAPYRTDARLAVKNRTLTGIITAI